MSPHRRYNLILAGILGPVVVVLLATSAALQPYDGGLTRLGGYAEKQYGWNEPQFRFPKPLYKTHRTRDAMYREPVDVVILGDSFTFLEQVSWPNYLAQMTGLSVAAYNIDKTTVDTLIASDGFRDNPPRIFIFESVERMLWDRLKKPASDCRVRPSSNQSPRAVRPLSVQPETYRRETRAFLLDLSLSIDFFAKVVPRDYFGRDRTKVARLMLDRDVAFSSIEKRQLLVYRDDLKKKDWTPEMWETVRCNLVDLQNRVQANGRTYFLAMVAPDKLSAYADLLTDRQWAKISRIDLLAKDPALHMPRLDQALVQAIQSDTVDVYLNNDTHWGSIGYTLVATNIVDFLTRAGVLAPRATR